MLTPPEVDRDAVPASLRHRVLAVLGLTQIVSWGVLYYAFPVLAPSISADTGWSLPQVTAAFSVALVASAGVGLLVGRRLDRRGPRAVMTIGSIVSALGLLGVAAAPGPLLFGAAWLLVGAGMAATLYPPAFAALTRLLYPRLSVTGTPGTRTALVLAATTITIGAFAVVPAASLPALATVAVFAGAARGLLTLVQATAVTDRWGSAHYGRLSSLLTGPALLATALAPWAGSVVAAQTGGYAPLFAVLAVATGAASLISART